MPEHPTLSEREVWKKATTIAAEFGNGDADHFAARLIEILRDTTNPQDWRRVAAAVDVIAAASKQ